MAEFDPTRPHDATEAAYRDALLADEAGRKQRRARLMAALPRPEVAAPVPVAPGQLAWRWSPYALSLLAMGLLLAVVLALKGPPHESKPDAGPRLAASPAASTAAVVAEADRGAEAAPARTPPPVAGKAVPPRMRAREPLVVAAAPSPVADKAVPPKLRAMEPVVVADASPPSPSPARESEAAPVAIPPPAAVIAAAPPPPAPAPAPAKPTPPAAPVAAALPAPPVLAGAIPPSASNDADVLARVEVSGVRAKASSVVSSLAASGAGELRAVRVPSAADAALLKAVLQPDPEAVRAALRAGASVHQRDALGRTMLMLAARAGAREVVDVLLASGARLTDRDAQGWTAADHARDRGHDELAERLR
ncbi:ankyrin repeat domain-containing protein [Roseateles sp. BYS78W]|uniref:Ankyrin repeat domain-containing protein n=1 Tax=Pelomonas candidula TaxID=3299025 RepID=A0ABW7H7Y3_9BURK